MHARFPDWDQFINTTCQLKYPNPSLGELCWLITGVEEFPSIVQLNSVRTSTLSRRDGGNIRGISLTSSTSSCSFAVSEVMFNCQSLPYDKIDFYAWLSNLPE